MKKALVVLIVTLVMGLFGQVEVTERATSDLILVAGYHDFFGVNDFRAQNNELNDVFVSTMQSKVEGIENDEDYESFSIGLYMNGSQVEANHQFNTDGTLTFYLDTMIPAAEEVSFSLRSSIFENAISELQFFVTSMDIVDAESGDVVAVMLDGTALSVSNPLIGSNITVVSEALEIANMRFSDKVIVGKEINNMGAKVSLRNRGQDDFMATAMKVQMVCTENCEGQYESFNTALLVDGVQQGSARRPDINGMINFNDILIMVALGDSIDVSLLVDIDLEQDLGPGTIQFMITSVDVDNIETGNSVMVLQSTQALSESSPVIGSIVNVISTWAEIENVVLDGDNTIIAGEDDLTAQKVVVSNYEPNDINVTSIDMKLFGTEICEEYQYFTAAVFADGIQQGSSKNPDVDGFISFNDLSVVIPVGSQKEFFIIHNTNEYSTPGTIQYTVINLMADNIETGQNVWTINQAARLTMDNPLDGPVFTLIKSGTLTVTESDFPIPDERVVLSACLHAQDDEIQVKDLYFKNLLHSAENDFGPVADFKLYGPDSTLIQTRQMQSNGSLHFELPNQSRIKVPKNDSTYFAIVIELRNTFEQTTKRLQLALDDTHVTKGIECLTAATGIDIPTPEEGWGELVSQEIVVNKISGPQSGTLSKGIYLADNISVEEGDSLFLEEGVEILFTESGRGLTVGGFLSAQDAHISSLYGESFYFRVDGEAYLNDTHIGNSDHAASMFIPGFLEISDSIMDNMAIIVQTGQLNLIRTTVNLSSISATEAVLYLGGCTLTGPDNITLTNGSFISLGSEIHNYDFELKNLSKMDIRWNDFIGSQLELRRFDGTKETKGDFWVKWNNFISSPSIALKLDGSYDGDFDEEVISNNIFFDNPTAIHAETTSAFELSHNCFFGNIFDLNEGEGVVDFGVINTTNVNGDPSDQHFNIFLNPQFGDAENGNYNLMFGSPCIDAGSDGTDIGARSYDPSGIETEEEVLPSKVHLEQNYPNPFNPVTTIAFSLANDTKVSLTVYNMLGQQVASLVNNHLTRGSHKVSFNGSALTSGIYYYVLNAGTSSLTRKMMLVK